MILKWVLVIVLSNSSMNATADSLSTVTVPMESREMCIRQSEFVRKSFDTSRHHVKTLCLQTQLER